MATTQRPSAKCAVDYPTSDGRPMGETDLHRQDMVDVIQTLQDSLRGRSERLCFRELASVL